MNTQQPQYIMIFGSPMNGWTYMGPFATPHDVEAYAERIGCPEAWFVGEVNPPDDDELGDPDEYEIQYNVPVTVTVRDDRMTRGACAPFVVTSVETNTGALRMSRGNEDVPNEVVRASDPSVTTWPEWTIR